MIVSTVKAHASVAAAVLVLLSSCGKQDPDGKVTMSQNGKYHAGQIWKYKTRKGEESSKVSIIRIDNNKVAGTSYHISVDNLQFKNPRIAGGIQRVLSHLPVSVETLDASVTELIATDADPTDEFEEGYKIWSDVSENGGGVFTVPVARVVELAEEGMSEKHDPERAQR